MALTAKSRVALYQGLTNVIDDDQAVEEMMSYFPARDVEEPVTKEFLRAEISDVRAEMSDVRAEISKLRAELGTETSGVRAEISKLRAELGTETSGVRAEISKLRAELGTETSGVRAEMSKLRAELGTEMTALELRLTDKINGALGWNIATMVAVAGVIIAAVRW